MPVHQPPDHEDDQDQPEYAADPNGPALTVVAAAVVPKPASNENHEQQDDQNQFHRSVFHQFVGNPCRAAVGSTGAHRAACGAATEVKVSKDASYRSGGKDRLAMRE
jgi:hypothetical protein